MQVLLVPSEPFDFPESPLLGIFQRHQAEALVEAGLQVGVVAPQPRSLRYLPVLARKLRGLVPPREGYGYPVLRAWGWDLFPRSPGIQRRVFLAEGERLFEAYRKRHGLPSLVHAHNTLSAGELALRLRERHGIPYLVTEHHSRFMLDDFDAGERERIGRVLGGARIVLSVSRVLAERMAAIAGHGVQPRVLPNVLPPEVESRRPDLAIPPGPEFTFLCVAGLDPVKNHEMLLRAFALAFREDPTTRLRLVGGGPLRRRLEALSARLGLSGQVTFTGALGRPETVEELARASAVVLASHHETFGVALIEAMWMGKPVVSTRCGGPDDVVEPGVGTLVAPGDEAAFAGALRAMRQRSSSFPASHVHERCAARYGRRAFAAELRSVYEEARDLR